MCFFLLLFSFLLLYHPPLYSVQILYKLSTVSPFGKDYTLGEKWQNWYILLTLSVFSWWYAECRYDCFAELLGEGWEEIGEKGTKEFELGLFVRYMSLTLWCCLMRPFSVMYEMEHDHALFNVCKSPNQTSVRSKMEFHYHRERERRGTAQLIHSVTTVSWKRRIDVRMTKHDY